MVKMTRTYDERMHVSITMGNWVALVLSYDFLKNEKENGMYCKYT